MNISIFGLGYVGCVGIGCLARQGHRVTGVDVSSLKVDQINAGKPTIIEKDIEGLVAEGRRKGLITATTDVARAILDTQVSFICVGTPNGANGHLDLAHVYAVAEEIGTALRSKEEFHVIVLRSTVMPGTNKKVSDIIGQASGKRRNEHFAIVSNPEFLREGSAVEDYFNPELIVLGADSKQAVSAMREIYAGIKGHIEEVPIEVAEIIKYVNNSYHALKIVFANEIGNICKKLGIDSHAVMRLFCQDKRLNISDKYFKPGFAYGGSCLPKDLKALRALSHDFYLESPIIENLEKSNFYQKEIAFEMIIEHGRRKVGFLGISFKPGTDDLRNSPAVELIERLLGKGYSVKVYDRNVHLSNLTGTNKKEIERRIPHLNNLISNDLSAVINESEILVFSYNEEGFADLISRYPEKIFVDLARVDGKRESEGNYSGLSW